jgi:peroxiredoxin Q/BCP
MPQVVVLDVRADPTVAWIDRGSSTFDRPSIDQVLEVLDRFRGDA